MKELKAPLMPAIEDDVRKRQSNTLPPDVIANDHYVDDVLWNGPKSGSRIQKAGGIIIGGTLILLCMADLNVFYQAGARFFLAPILVLTAFGARIFCQAVRGRKKSTKPGK